MAQNNETFYKLTLFSQTHHRGLMQDMKFSNLTVIDKGDKELFNCKAFIKTKLEESNCVLWGQKVYSFE